MVLSLQSLKCKCKVKVLIKNHKKSVFHFLSLPIRVQSYLHLNFDLDIALHVKFVEDRRVSIPLLFPSMWRSRISCIGCGIGYSRCKTNGVMVPGTSRCS